jgi:hypothetical protein
MAPDSALSVKDIVIDRVTAPAPRTALSGTHSVGDAMSVSVLVESPDGTLAPRSTATMFRTGERFRVRLLASREGRVSFYNTNPLGMFNATPVWQGYVRPGQEAISPRLVLTGHSGVDQLHVVLEPTRAGPIGAVAWLQGAVRQARDGFAGKDIRLDVEHSTSHTYLLNRRTQGLHTTIRIAHH